MTILILSLLLAFSLCINIILFRYSKFLVGRIKFIFTNTNNLIELINEYQKFVEHMYSLEMFYGEPILEKLIKNTKSVSMAFKVFEKQINIFSNEKEQDEQNRDTTTEEETYQEEDVE